LAPQERFHNSQFHRNQFRTKTFVLMNIALRIKK
jgi:hypothetical protein